MKRIFLALVSFLFFVTVVPSVFAQAIQTTSKDTFYQASVVSTSPANKSLDATVQGKTVQVTYEPQSSGKIHQGDTIVIGKIPQANGGGARYYFVDQYRLWPLLYVVLGFFLFIFLIAGWKGFGSIGGLLISLGVIFLYTIPQIIAGGDPLTVCLIGSLVILFATTYIAHGFSRQTTIALVATLVGLFATYFIAQFVTYAVGITGYGDQSAADLLFGLPKLINLQGLFLGGILLATLGALNDITVTQSAAIFSLHKTSPTLPFKDLAEEGFNVGREHALSLINTLVLAFAGTALSLFIFILANPNGQPLWVVLNSEFIVEEVMKTIAGTAGLLLVVPLVTLIAALSYDKDVQSFFKSIVK